MSFNSPRDMRARLDRSGPDAVALDLLAWHPAEIADTLAFIGPDHAASVLAVLPASLAAHTLLYVRPVLRCLLLDASTVDRLAEYLDSLSPDCAALLFEQLRSKQQRSVAAELAPATLLGMESVRRYPSGTVGRLLIPDVARLSPETSVAEAIRSIRRERIDPRSLPLLFLVDHGDHLLGTVRFRELILAAPTALLGQLPAAPCVTVSPETQVPQAVRLMLRSGLRVLPVVDADGLLLGAITLKAVILHRAWSRLERQSQNLPPPVARGLVRLGALLSECFRWLQERGGGGLSSFLANAPFPQPALLAAGYDRMASPFGFARQPNTDFELE